VSSGNVFVDIGFSEEEAERELLRSDLAFEIYSILEERKLAQSEIGKVLDIDQSDVSRLKNGEFQRFSLERLLTFLNRLNRDVEIRITPTKDMYGHQRVVTTYRDASSLKNRKKNLSKQNQSKQKSSMMRKPNMNRVSPVQIGNFVPLCKLTANEVGPLASEEDLAEILRSFNSREILIALARINLLLQCSDNFAKCESILRKNFCTPVLQNAIDASEELRGRIIFNRESTLYLLSKSIGVSNPRSPHAPDATLGARNNLARCYLIANALMEAKSTAVTAGPSKQQRTTSVAELIPSREYAINPSPWPHIKRSLVRSEEYWSRLKMKTRGFDVCETLLHSTGLTREDYQYLIFSILAVAMKFSQTDILDGNALFIDTKKYPRLTPLYNKLLKHICISIDELASTLHGEEKCSLPNEFRAWRKYPLVKLRENEILSIDNGFLKDKLETGVFWIIQDGLKKDEKNKGNQIIQLQGEIFEDYAASIIERGINNQTPSRVETCIRSPKYVQKTEKECTDIAVIGGEALALLECKSPVLAARTKFSNNYSNFRNGIRRNVMKGIKQLSNAIQLLGHANESEMRKVQGIDMTTVKKIYPVLVLSDPIFSLVFMNRNFNFEFKNIVRYCDLKPHLKIMPLSVLTVEDLEYLEPYLNDTPLHVHLDNWLQIFNRNESLPFGEYLRFLREKEPRENPYIEQEFKRIHADIMEYFTSRGVE
jgi:predicted XRE-type DNA-binding protein